MCNDTGESAGRTGHTPRASAVESLMPKHWHQRSLDAVFLRWLGNLSRREELAGVMGLLFLLQDLAGPWEGLRMRARGDALAVYLVIV